MNNVIIIGRLIKDVELKGEGKVCNFTLAVTRLYKNADGLYESDFINCVAFGNVGNNLAEYCHKGDTIAVKGRLQTDNYEVNGEKRYSTKVNVERITFLSNNKEKKEEDPFKAMGNIVSNDSNI